jgi:hypothetical protein
MRRALAAISGLLLTHPGLAAAQRDCFPPDDSNEAQLFAAFSAPLAFSLLEAPAGPEPGAVRVGLEGTYLPNIDQEIRTPTICRPGKGPEDTDLLFGFARPRVRVGLPAGLSAEASWVPPIRLNGAKANLVGLSLQRAMRLGRGGMLLGVRLHGTFGVIRAPITCNDEALQDENSECYQGTRSDDSYHPNIVGAEVALGWVVGGGRIHPFVGAGLNLLYPRFRVNFTNRFGDLDDSRVEVDLTRGAIFGGATWAASRVLGVTGEIYASPGDAVTGRVMLSYALRR